MDEAVDELCSRTPAHFRASALTLVQSAEEITAFVQMQLHDIT